MSESRQPYKSQDEFLCPETGASCLSGMKPVEIMITPPTPMVGDADFVQLEEDTLKEVFSADRSAEEKEVYDLKDVSGGKPIHVADEKEVHIPESKGFQDQHVDGTEKEVNYPATWGNEAEKEFVPSAEDRFNKIQLQDMSEKEIYVPGAAGLGHEDASPTQADADQHKTETGDDVAKAKSSMVQRQLDSMGDAVDKRKKALATFTSESNTRLRDGYARFGRRVTDSGVAIEQGASDRYKRLGKGISNHLTRVEQGTTTRYAQMEKGLNDQACRAGKNITTRVANLKQGVNNLRKLGSRIPGSNAERRQIE